MTAFSRLRGNKGYGACDDAAPLVAVPMLLLLLIGLLVSTRKKKR